MGRNLRVVTLNFWGTEPPLDRRLALAMRQLRALAPDVVCLQEVRPLDGVPGRTTADVIADALGMAAHYAASDGRSATAGGAGGPRDPREDDPRRARAAAARARGRRRAHPAVGAGRDGGGPIWVHTTHLHYRLDDGVAREHQVLAIDEAIRGFGRGDDDPPQILCGDFNADARQRRDALPARADHARRPAHALPGRVAAPPPRAGARRRPGAGHHVVEREQLTRPLRSLDIDRRIDYVYVTSRKKDGRGTVHDCRVVLTEREGADEICASDHYGVLADVQVVSGN